jgi:hypothetical protein
MAKLLRGLSENGMLIRENMHNINFLVVVLNCEFSDRKEKQTEKEIGEGIPLPFPNGLN